MNPLSRKMLELGNYANQKMREHGLISKGWSFGWNKRKRSFGLCNYSTKQITLSRFMLECGESMESMKGTIMHEIAHAIAGHKAGHGPQWAKVMIELGQEPRRCREARGAVIKHKWYRKCPSCDYKKGYHRRPKDKDSSCPYCSGGRYNEEFKIQLVRGEA